MLRVGATALVLCGLTAAPGFAHPLAGIEAQFYPDANKQTANPAAWDDLLTDVAPNAVSDSDLKSMSGGRQTFNVTTVKTGAFGQSIQNTGNFSTPGLPKGQSVPANTSSDTGLGISGNTGAGSSQTVHFNVNLNNTGGSK